MYDLTLKRVRVTTFGLEKQ